MSPRAGTTGRLARRRALCRGGTVPWESPCPISPGRQDGRGNAPSWRSGAEPGLWQLRVSGGMQKDQWKVCLFNTRCTQFPQFHFAFKTLFTPHTQEWQELPGCLTGSKWTSTTGKPASGPCTKAQEMLRHEFRPTLPLKTINTATKQIKQHHSPLQAAGLFSQPLRSAKNSHRNVFISRDYLRLT